jgi:shikimate kinase
MKNNLLYLTGFMASGKSTIGPILANTIGWDFLDLDKVIESDRGKSIKAIFEECGEDYFRQIETEMLQRLSQLNNHVISLGGGTIVSDKNLEILKSTGYLIYLESSPEESYHRLRFKRDRPALLFDSDEEPTKAEFINKINLLLEKRLKYYNQADVKINTDNANIGKTVDKLVSIIKREIDGKKTKN